MPGSNYMTSTEQKAKSQIMKYMAEQGYLIYVEILDDFDLHLTDRDDVIGYTVPNEYTITVNRGLDKQQASMVIRHELLHNILQHHLRMENKLGKEKWANRTPEEHAVSNYAGDFDICNTGYTERDKNDTRNLMRYGKPWLDAMGQQIRGLITEDDPEYAHMVNMSFEDMYDEITKLNQQEQEKMKQQMEQNDRNNQQKSSDYVNGWNKIMKAFSEGKLSESDIEKISNASDSDIDQILNSL